MKKAKIAGRKLKLSAESLNLIGWQVSRENTAKQNGGRWGDSNNVLIQSLREKANNKNTWQRENNELKV